METNLLETLKMLIPRIKGKWFLGDGALLGIIREGGLLKWDNDIDLYILQDTTFDLQGCDLKKQKYYICDKIYNVNNDKCKVNPWLEYCSIIKLNNQQFNRSQVLSLASKDYKEKKIIPEFTKDHIDIFILKKGEDSNYRVNKKTGFPHSITTYYTEDDLNLQKNYSLGFEINIPNNSENILERTYGKDWRTPNALFKQF
tara:strand:- start:233 stop:832 length:600 start_codon:yes stop_codon:yes gene_type:complete